MSNRLDQEREARLEPKVFGGKRIEFEYKGMKVTFWPYSGWHSGKGITDGRGFNNLKEQLK